jgi:hypothetical protein
MLIIRKGNILSQNPDHYNKMTLQELCRIIKLKTDAVLPDYKGKVGIGGNIFHKKKMPFGYTMIWQDILSRGNFPICCSLAVFDNLLGYNLGVVMQLTKKEAEECLWIDLGSINFSETDVRFEISDEKSIENWFDFLNKELPTKAEDVFNRYSTLDNFESLLNDGFLEMQISTFEFWGTRKYELGLVAAKLLNKPYFVDIFNKHREISNVRGSDFTLYQRLFDYLCNTPESDLKDIGNLLNRLKK